MRRMDREVKRPDEIVAIMAKCDILRIALNTQMVPYILPVSFGMEPDGMVLYIHGAAAGTKYELIARDHRCSFEMDCNEGLVLDETDHSCTMQYASVIGWGYLEEITDPAEKRHALMTLMAHYHAGGFPVDMGPMPRTRVLRLRVQERTAKRRR